MADFGQSMTEEACLAVATPFITARMGDPESVIFEDLKCYRGLEGAVPVARVEATYGYRFAGQVDSKGIIGRYSGMTPFSGVVRDDGEGPKGRSILHRERHNRLPLLHTQHGRLTQLTGSCPLDFTAVS